MPRANILCGENMTIEMARWHLQVGKVKFMVARF